MRCHLVERPVGHNAHGAIGKIPEESGKRLLQTKDNGEIVGDLEVIHVTVGGGASGADLALKHRVEGPLDVARGQRPAVVERHAAAEVENVGLRVRDFPAFGERRSDVEMFITIQQIVKDECVDALRLRVDADSGIEICRTALDDHHERVGIWSLGAGEERE